MKLRRLKNQSWFKAHLNDNDKLDKNSLKLHVNSHTEEYKDNYPLLSIRFCLFSL